MPIEIRAVTIDEVDDMWLADQRGFGQAPPAAEQSRSWAEGELDRTRVAFEDGHVVGVSRNYSFELTMPGGALVPAAAVSWVSVLPTHRRRGVLTRMMAALHDDARARDEPIAMLTASEGLIYGRFGYGVATLRVGLLAERARVKFAREDDDSGSMRLATRAEAEALLPAIYDRTRRLRAGMVTRPDSWWPAVFWDHLGGGTKKAFFVAIHRDAAGVDDGFVAYEITGEWHGGLPDGRLLVWDMQAMSADVCIALWRYCFGVDLVATVVATNVALDDPLRHVVVDARRVRVDYVNDGLWVAPLDVAAALAARSYAIDGALVIEVESQRYGLDGGPQGATCTRTDATADLSCSRATLGAVLLGGNAWSTLAQAGLIDEHAPGSLVRADLMFWTTPAPALLSYF